MVPRKKWKRTSAITRKSAAFFFHFRSKRDAKAIRTNKKPSLEKLKPTCRWTTRSFISRHRLPNNYSHVKTLPNDCAFLFVHHLRARGGTFIHVRYNIRPGRAQHRFGRDERTHLGDRGNEGAFGENYAFCRCRQRRRLEIRRWRNPISPGF